MMHSLPAHILLTYLLTYLLSHETAQITLNIYITYVQFRLALTEDMASTILTQTPPDYAHSLYIRVLLLSLRTSECPYSIHLPFDTI